MCEWMGIQVIEKHRRIVMKVLLVGRMGEKDGRRSNIEYHEGGTSTKRDNYTSRER